MVLSIILYKKVINFWPVSFVSAFVSRATVTGICYHGDHYHAIEVVWYPSTVCYGFTLGFKTGK